MMDGRQIFRHTRPMKLHTHTEPGGKLVNEDFVLARRHPLADDIYIGALADGQGGRSNAALASRTACERVWSLASALPVPQLFNPETWRRIVQQADEAVALTGGFTTLVAFAISHDTAVGASVGDSKAYFKRPTDQEMTEWSVGQRKNPPVGSGSVDAVPFMVGGQDAGRLLVVSDGVWKFCGYEALLSSFAQSQETLTEHLRGALLQRAGSSLPDDFSLIAVDVG